MAAHTGQHALMTARRIVRRALIKHRNILLSKLGVMAFVHCSIPPILLSIPGIEPVPIFSPARGI
jgi:hypothetical protein